MRPVISTIRLSIMKKRSNFTKENYCLECLEKDYVHNSYLYVISQKKIMERCNNCRNDFINFFERPNFKTDESSSCSLKYDTAVTKTM